MTQDLKDLLPKECPTWNELVNKSQEEILRLEKEESYLIGQMQKIQKNLDDVKETKYSLIAGNESGKIAMQHYYNHAVAILEEANKKDNDKVEDPEAKE